MKLLKLSDFVALIAFVITAAEFTYWLGRRTRQAINSANDTLAAMWAVSWGVGEDRHYSALSEVLDMIATILAPASPVEPFPVLVVAAPPAPPVPSAPPAPRKPRPARRRRASTKTQD